MKKVVIVESPSKTKSIKSYLGNDYIVTSSKGHIRDLAISGKGGLGIDVLNNFEPNYEVLKEKESVVKYLQKVSKDNEVYIATDPDREGEAIGFHIAEVLGLDLKTTKRVEFREITRPAILEAMKNPKTLNLDLVESQETRRMLDRIIGFKLSTLLQKKINSKSAGRVQSVALKLICDLEKEIKDFKKETYYEVGAYFADFEARYIIPSNKRLSKDEANLIVKESGKEFKVVELEEKEYIRYPKPAYTTSSLQQDAITNLGMSGERVMRAAQSLYEGVSVNGENVGLITYMRTDSTRISPIFINKIKKHISETYGDDYVGTYRPLASAGQDAHEGIRPTRLDITPIIASKYIDNKDQIKLYERIYERAVASLMKPAIFNNQTLTLDANNHLYKADGSILIFDGFTKCYDDIKSKNKLLPKLNKDNLVTANDVLAEKKETKPKARYSEATIIKELEKHKIGRPSTYALIIKTLKMRAYVKEVKRRLIPTEQGIITSDALEKYFEPLINIDYSSKMEADLDQISNGKLTKFELLNDFYYDFENMLDKAKDQMDVIPVEKLDEVCPLCGKPLVLRKSQYGTFIGCSGFPKCKYIKKDK